MVSSVQIGIYGSGTSETAAKTVKKILDDSEITSFTITKSKSNSHEGGRYEQGQKRCTQCELFIKWDSLWCPCCGRLLRTKPRATKSTRRLSLMRKSRES